MRKERLDFGPEDEAPPVAVIEQRLLPRAVPREHETAGTLVPHRDGKHAVEILDERRPALFVEMDDDLGVGEGPEPVAACEQTLAQLVEAVDLAVEDAPHGAVLVCP